MGRRAKERIAAADGKPAYCPLMPCGTFKTRPNPKLWQFERNPGQERIQPLLADERYDEYLIYGGARGGKTYDLIYTIFIRALKAAGSRHVILRKHFIDAKRSLGIGKATIPTVIANHFPGLGIVCNKTDWFWTLPNGSEVWIGGLDDGERVEKILGNEYCTIYFNEASEVDYESFTTLKTRLAQRCELKDGTLLRNIIYLDENPSSVRHWTYLRYVQGLDPESKAKLPKDVFSRFGVGSITPADNQANQSPQFLRSLEGLPRAKRMRYLLGVFSSDTEGALWKAAWIDEHRVVMFDWHRLGRIVVGVDPAVTSNKKSDHTGIVVAGTLDGDPAHYYVLADVSGKYTPLEWGRKAVSLYYEYQADCIVGENNQGGDLVESNLHRVDPTVRVKLVHATRGKWIRAEPIAGMYERGMVHHVGEFPDLEAEQTTWKPDDADSPDRMDALVWTLTELSGGGWLRLVNLGDSALEAHPMDTIIKGQEALQKRIETGTLPVAQSSPNPMNPLDKWSQDILRQLDDGF